MCTRWPAGFCNSTDCGCMHQGVQTHARAVKHLCMVLDPSITRASPHKRLWPLTQVQQQCSRGSKECDAVQRRAVGGGRAGMPPTSCAATTSHPSTTSLRPAMQPQGGAVQLLLTIPLAGQLCPPPPSTPRNGPLDQLLCLLPCAGHWMAVRGQASE